MKNTKHNFIRFSSCLFVLAVCLLLLGLTTQAASQTPAGWTVSTYNGHSIITTNTGAQWLSPTATLGKSYKEVKAETKDPNSPLYGFHTVGKSKVGELFTAYGMTAWNQWGQYQNCIAFLEDFAPNLLPISKWTYFIGISGTGSGLYRGQICGPFVRVHPQGLGTFGSGDGLPACSWPNRSYSNKGVWLYSSTIVIPPELPNEPPVAKCKDVTVSADANCEANASIDNGSSDPDGDPITISQSPSGPYPLGDTEVTLTVTDDKGESSTCTATVTVIDDTAPEISIANSQLGMWPPNHKYKTFRVNNFGVSVTDNCGCCVEAKITGVSSSEPDDAKGGGDGNTKNDIVIASDGKSVKLRAERMGGGDGRVYTITLSATDAAGNTATATCEVIVPHDRSGLPKGIGGFVTDSEMALPEDYFLSQNYPNPFNPTTTISFGLPQAENVTLNIYNSAGQLIRTLTRAQYSAGTHNITWDATDYSGVRVANGIYIYELRANNFVQQRKMLLMK